MRIENREGVSSSRRNLWKMIRRKSSSRHGLTFSSRFSLQSSAILVSSSLLVPSLVALVVEAVAHKWGCRVSACVRAVAGPRQTSAPTMSWGDRDEFFRPRIRSSFCHFALATTPPSLDHCSRKQRSDKDELAEGNELLPGCRMLPRCFTRFFFFFPFCFLFFSFLFFLFRPFLSFLFFSVVLRGASRVMTCSEGFVRGDCSSKGRSLGGFWSSGETQIFSFLLHGRFYVSIFPKKKKKKEKLLHFWWL